MTPTVIHQPRVAWDAARAFVRMAGGPGFDAYAGRVLARLGPEMYGELAGTRRRLLAASVESGDRFAADVEAGRWRVRLEDLLRSDPSLIAPVRELTEAAAR
ncbi:hypothetical protein GCM10020358_39270 [Amorphoplanes nipponensis]|uniref:Uncharacterized protein n=1 Tax=Actinoplanes nipponensis TaxID=135950 RepID=A0A919MIR6_9ACTN|nr:hypothetical protein [Actinoplanes nipponensis]GIE51034.1 hypothetical protein Ani05nite_45680 [Actinoplanes nipponensis]